MRKQKKDGFSSRSMSLITLLYLLYLIGNNEKSASHQYLCDSLCMSYPTLHRNLRLLREAFAVDVRSKRMPDNSTHFYINNWGIFTKEQFLSCFEDSLLNTASDLIGQKASEKLASH